MQFKKKNTAVFYFELIEQIAFCSYLENKYMKDFLAFNMLKFCTTNLGHKK